MNRQTWLLATMAAAGRGGLTPVRLQKVMFLLGENLRWTVPHDYYAFRAYDYGPFSHEVYEDAERLERDGLVEITRPMNWSWRQYRATEQGLIEGQRLLDQLHVGVRNYVEQLVAWANGLDFASLVTQVYSLYPNYRANSIFR